jgi:hypothetical protein
MAQTEPAVGAPLERHVRPRVERLRWWDAQRHPPGHDNTVLVLLRDARPFAQPRWSAGYWDAGTRLWRDDDMKAFAVDTVALYWAEPDGPSGA